MIVRVPVLAPVTIAVLPVSRTEQARGSHQPLRCARVTAASTSAHTIHRGCERKSDISQDIQHPSWCVCTCVSSLQVLIRVRRNGLQYRPPILLYKHFRRQSPKAKRCFITVVGERIGSLNWLFSWSRLVQLNRFLPP